ncbi:MAG: carbamoyltransferase HypF [Bacteroidetes bacterium]|jgi:hydrogenase maturation protein HypF|nr:carbamoyltransferase HypF [Bacteroidota bacterium]
MIKNKNRNHSIISREIIIRGLVQGIGFRPFIYRLAHDCQLNGWVRNTNEAVLIRIEGKEENYNCFRLRLHSQKPWTAIYSSMEEKDVSPMGYNHFTIEASEDVSDQVTRVSPDIAVCEACLDDMRRSSSRNYYPLVNCTFCGPRFSIIKSLPYDRKHTSMAEFILCEQCQIEYHDIMDRRFHAQPIACNQCGPHYELWKTDHKTKNIHEILNALAIIIDNGGVLAMKGTGGYHLMVDAGHEDAVHKLRSIKQRDQKPFALMFKDIKCLREYAYINNAEQNALTNWKRPIVLLRQKKSLVKGINEGFGALGVMLPYMPMHFLMFDHLKTPVVVMTSGNLRDEPIVTENQVALKKFGDRVDGIVVYNRDIHNRIDDSVVKVVGDKQRIIRRARGFVPLPVQIPVNVDNILATGAELTNCFAVGKGKEVIMSQHLGDLKDFETYTFYTETIEKFKSLFRVNPQIVATDKHPDYLATQYARELELPLIEVQHHHAHIAGCMAEHNQTEPVIGVCFDGTGLGDDGHIWGGEFMYTDLNSFERFIHFEYLPLPGGDKSIKDPWRTAIACLYRVYGRALTGIELPFMNKVNMKDINLVLDMLDREINTPQSSAVGRLFDAIAALTGTCIHSDFHAQAPMLFEALTDESIQSEYTFNISSTIQLKATIKEIVDDIIKKIPIPVIATKFHNTLVSIIVYCVKNMMKRYASRKVVLSGGVFQNAFLLEKTERELAKLEVDVLIPLQVPCNDGGLALGQIAVAAAKREQQKK